MTAEVVCMALANVPSGEQRSRFLAVGLADNTVRVISLDPNVSCHPCHFICINDENLG
jgi:splicing factor 3B subunit 3